MEAIFTLIKGAFVIGGILLGLIALVMPVILHINFKNKTGENLLDFRFTALDIVALFLIMGKAQSGECAGEIILFIVAMIITFVFACKRADRLNMHGTTKIIAVAAQLLSPFSVLFILIMISNFINNLNKKKDDDE